MNEETKNKKEQLVEEVIKTIGKDMYNYHSLIFDLIREALNKWSIKDLKGLL